MRFSNKKEEFIHTIETVALIISVGAIFLQIWVLLSGIETYLKGKYTNLLPSVILSGLAFIACGVSVLLTNIDFLKGMMEGRSKTYQKKDY
ncbi:MAG: hypothetical protein KBD53_09865 [Candidatus Omnitrophica bacterium]|nr:hypothetical protein [Candidatus Omnitrophota bacterium]